MCLASWYTHCDSFAAPMDYTGISGMAITFDPYGPMTGCLTISIDRDFVVENTESFSFSIDDMQEDVAVEVGMPQSATVTILDEEGG